MVAEQLSTCKLSQTNPKSQSEDLSVPQTEKSRDLETLSLTEALQELHQQSILVDKWRQGYEAQLVQTIVTNQDRKLFKRKQKLLEILYEAIEELGGHMTYIQEDIGSTQNKVHLSDTGDITKDQMYYSLIS